jgi:hypothetical protein
MYAEFLQGLADLATSLNEAAKIGSDGPIPTPYLAGKVEVRLEGEPVGYFEFEDEWVIYHSSGEEDAMSGPRDETDA